MKLVPGVVPALPVSAQPEPPPHPPEGVCHVERPAASEVRTFPAHGVPQVIFTCPAISSFAHGVEVPIPIFPPLP